MGSWSTKIMGGDEPLDFQGFIYDELDIEMYPDDQDDRTDIPKETLEKEQKNLIKFIKGKKADYMDSNVGLMVLGVMMMEVGAKMTEPTKKAILKAAEKDEWAQDDEERAADVKAFIKTIKKFKDQPTSIENEGLFEVIAKAIVGKKKGLVNR